MRSTPLRPADRPELLPFEVKLGGLPECGGFEVTECIEAGPCEEAGDPLLALPANGIPEEKQAQIIVFVYIFAIAELTGWLARARMQARALSIKGKQNLPNSW